MYQCLRVLTSFVLIRTDCQNFLFQLQSKDNCWSFYHTVNISKYLAKQNEIIGKIAIWFTFRFVKCEKYFQIRYQVTIAQRLAWPIATCKVANQGPPVLLCLRFNNNSFISFVIVKKYIYRQSPIFSLVN